jgi:hypothetical protein
MSAMQAMMAKMIGDMMQNLPPDIQEKINAMGDFTGRLDGRLSAIEDDLRCIKAHLGISDQRMISNGHGHERSDDDERTAVNAG